MFYNNLKNACSKKGISISALTKELALAKGNQTYWKAGRLPNAETLLRISEYLNVSIDYLLTGEHRTIDQELDADTIKLMEMVEQLPEKEKGIVKRIIEDLLK